MSMSTYIYGCTPPDATWLKMKEVWDACKNAGVDIPDEVYNFFDGEIPDPASIEVDLEKYGCAKEYSDEYRQGYEINVDKIPKHIKIIRVQNSW